MQCLVVRWDSPNTDKTLRSAGPGKVLGLGVWTGSYSSPNARYHVRVATEPETLITWHRCVDDSIFGRDAWLEFQVVFGDLVFDHAVRLDSAPRPIWRVYPKGGNAELARPAAVVYRLEDDRPGLISVARIWFGKPGQDPSDFSRQVLATMPRPLTVQQRFAIRRNAAVQVLVAAAPSPERDNLIHDISIQSNGLVIAITADTAEEVMDRLADTDVVILADQLPPCAGENQEATYARSFIREALWRRKIPLVGWPVNVEREYGTSNDRSGSVRTRLRGVCGHVLTGYPEPERSVVNLILDALGVRETREG